MENGLIIFITLILSAFFAGIETAFISASKLRIELRSKQGSRSARILGNYVNAPSKFMSTTLVGTHIALVVFALVMEQDIARLLHLSISDIPLGIALIVKTLLATAILLIVGEFLPRVIFRFNADYVLQVLIYPFQLFYYLLWPEVQIVLALSKVILNRFSTRPFDETPVFTKGDLDEYITKSNQTDLEDDADVDTEMFRNALDFANVKVRDCMVHRTDLVAIEVSEPIDALYQEFVNSHHSKILVYEGDIDHIIGYAHLVDMYKKPGSISSMLIPIMIANESMPANDLLNQLTQNHKSMALVVNEVGTTAGIVTTEDIMEKIFGKIEDEHDVELKQVKISDTEYEFSARLEIAYLNETYHLDIPGGDYETLGGYIISRHANIPSQGDVLHMDHFEFEILSTSSARIEDVRLRLM